MIEAMELRLVDKDKVQSLRETAEDCMKDPRRQDRGCTIRFALDYLGLWDNNPNYTSFNEEGDMGKETDSTDGATVTNDRDQMTTLLDRLDGGEMDEKEAIEFALAYFEGVASADMSKKYAVREICDLMWALHRCES